MVRNHWNWKTDSSQKNCSIPFYSRCCCVKIDTMALPCMACKYQMFLVKCLKDPSDKFNHQVSHNSACPGHQVLGNWESISTISLPQDISTSIESSFCGTLSPQLILPRLPHFYFNRVILLWNTIPSIDITKAPTLRSNVTPFCGIIYLLHFTPDFPFFSPHLSLLFVLSTSLLINII